MRARFAADAIIAQNIVVASALRASIAKNHLRLFVPIAEDAKIVASASIAAVVAQLWNTLAGTVKTGQNVAVTVPIAKLAARMFPAAYAKDANGVPIVARAKRARGRHNDSKSKNPPMRKAIKRMRANVPCLLNWNCALCQKSLR